VEYLLLRRAKINIDSFVKLDQCLFYLVEGSSLIASDHSFSRFVWGQPKRNAGSSLSGSRQWCKIEKAIFVPAAPATASSISNPLVLLLTTLNSSQYDDDDDDDDEVS